MAAVGAGKWTAAVIEAGHALEEALADPEELQEVAGRLGAGDAWLQLPAQPS